jgi:hypothetical protein
VSADLVPYLLGPRPTLAIDSGDVRDVLTLMNTINRLNDSSCEIAVVISAIRLRALRDLLGPRFELWRSVLRAKNVVVTGFEEQDAIRAGIEGGGDGAMTADRLVLDQASAEGYVLITRVALSERAETVMHATLDEVSAAVERVSNLSTSLRVVRNGSSSTEAKIAALEDLVDARHPDLPRFLADALEASDLAPAWRDALIYAVEHTQVTDPTLRPRVIASLLRHARVLRDEGSGATLWSAVRRYASMVPVDASDGLLEFLRPEDVATTKQVALQGIFNIYSVERHRHCTARDRLRERVHALAMEHIDPERACDATQVALAHVCLRAAAALEHPALDDLLLRLESLGFRRITERAVALVNQLKEQRTRGEV